MVYRTVLVRFLIVLHFFCAVQAQANNCTQAPDLLQEIIKKGEIKVGWVSAKPFQYVDENGDLKGAFVEAGNMLANDFLNVDITWVEARWDTFIAGLQTGKFDIVISNVARRSNRALSIWFTKPIAFGSQALLIRKDSGISSISDIDKEGNTIVVRLGSAAHSAYTEDHKNFFKNAQIKSIVPPVHAEQEVASGRAIAMGAPVSELAHIVRANNDWADILLVPNARAGGGIGFVVPQCQHNLLHFMDLFIDTLVERKFMAEQAQLYPDLLAEQFVAPKVLLRDLKTSEK